MVLSFFAISFSCSLMVLSFSSLSLFSLLIVWFFFAMSLSNLIALSCSSSSLFLVTSFSSLAIQVRQSLGWSVCHLAEWRGWMLTRHSGRSSLDLLDGITRSSNTLLLVICNFFWLGSGMSWSSTRDSCFLLRSKFFLLLEESSDCVMCATWSRLCSLTS